MPSIWINGKYHEVGIDPKTPLLWYLRDHLGLMGTKYSCGIAECGTYQAVRSAIHRATGRCQP